MLSNDAHQAGNAHDRACECDAVRGDLAAVRVLPPSQPRWSVIVRGMLGVGALIVAYVVLAANVDVPMPPPLITDATNPIYSGEARPVVWGPCFGPTAWQLPSNSFSPTPGLCMSACTITAIAIAGYRRLSRG